MQAGDKTERRIGAESSDKTVSCPQDSILDQRSFVLDADAHEKFLALLEMKISVTKELRARMRRKPSWER
jgi:uncharacterized protein (DUF1778 family)